MPKGTYKIPGQPYFFLNGHLHKILKEVKHEDKIVCMDYDDGVQKLYFGVDLARKREKAFSMKETCVLLEHSRWQIWRAIVAGGMPDGHEARPPGGRKLQYAKFWRAEDLLKGWEWFAQTHIGHPRKDGGITNNMPTRAEFRERLEGGRQLYILNDDGVPIPIWRQNEL